jgi:hypothetical protein
MVTASGGASTVLLPPECNVMTEQTLAAPIDERQELSRGFSRYESILVALLALVQFTIIIDFTIMSPLGAIIMPALDISPAQFGEFPASWPPALPIGSIANGCCCFFMAALPLERPSAPSLRTITCCCRAGSSPACSAA